MFPDSDNWRSSYSPYEVAAAAFDEIRISTKAAIISSTAPHGEDAGTQI